MKKIPITVLFLFFACFICSAQYRPVLALNNQLTLKRVTAGVFVIPSAGLQRGRNMLLLGPVVRLARLDDVLPNKSLLTGIKADYRYTFTRQESRKLRFFGEWSGKYQQLEEEWVSNYWSESKYRYVDYEAESEEAILESNLGAGFSWNFHPNISLFSSIGAGYYLSTLRYDDVDELPDLARQNDYRGYGPKGIFYSFQLGVVYRFKEEVKLRRIF